MSLQESFYRQSRVKSDLINVQLHRRAFSLLGKEIRPKKGYEILEQIVNYSKQ